MSRFSPSSVKEWNTVNASLADIVTVFARNYMYPNETDWGVGINRAITSLNGNGGKIIIPSGNLNINTPIQMASYLTIEGAGISATTINAIGCTAFKTSDQNQNFKISDMKIIGNTTPGTYGFSIEGSNTFHFELENLRIESFDININCPTGYWGTFINVWARKGNYGFKTDYDSTHYNQPPGQFRFFGCTFTDCNFSEVMIGNCSEISFYGGTIGSAVNYGVDVFGPGIVKFDGTDIEGNANGGVIIRVNSKVTLQDCTILDNGTNTWGVTVQAPTYLTAIGNTTRGHTNGAFQVSAGCVFINNEINESTRYNNPLTPGVIIIETAGGASGQPTSVYLGGAKINNVNQQGWSTQTPTKPASAGYPSGEVVNPNPYACVVYQTGGGIPHVADSTGSYTALPSAVNMFIIPANGKVYFETTVPTSWLWMGM